MLHKRICWLVISLLIISASMIIFTRLGSRQTSAAPKGPRMKVLRRKDQLGLKPTKEEIAYNQSGSQEERGLEDKVPKHLPIKIKIRSEKEKAFKDLNNERWARDLELELKNTGDKAIYYIELILMLPELQVGGHPAAFDMHYGRDKLHYFETKLEPEDVPIKPGETYVFKVPEKQAFAWEKFQQSENWSQPKKILLEFNRLNFGDGTGFWGNTGGPWPESSGKKPGLGACLQEPKKSEIRTHHALPSKATGAWRLSVDALPTSFPSAKFLAPESSSPLVSVSTRSVLQPASCCSGENCTYRYEADVDLCENCGFVHRQRQ